MVPWLKAAVLAGLFYSESPPITTGTPNQCTKLSTRVYDCPTLPISNCPAPFIGSVRNEETCTIDEFSTTFDLTGIDRMMIDPTASVDVNVHYTFFDQFETNRAFPRPSPLYPLPNECSSLSTRFVKNNTDTMWLICYSETTAEVYVYFGSVSGATMNWALLFSIGGGSDFYTINQMKLAKTDTANGMMAMRLDYSLADDTLCNGLADTRFVCSQLGIQQSKIASNLVFLCSGINCASPAISDVIISDSLWVLSAEFEYIRPFQPDNELSYFDPEFVELGTGFLQDAVYRVERVREKHLNKLSGVNLDWTFPAQMTFSLYDGGIWITYLNGNTVKKTTLDGNNYVVEATSHSALFECSSWSDCPALDVGGADPDFKVSKYVPVEYYSDSGYDKMVLSTVCLDKNVGGCGILAVFSPASPSPSLDDDIEAAKMRMGVTLVYGWDKDPYYDDPLDRYFGIEGHIGIDYSQRITYSADNPNNFGCWVKSRSAKYSTTYDWTALTAKIRSEETLELKFNFFDWQDLLFLEGSFDDMAFDGVFETSLRRTGQRFNVSSFDDPYQNNHMSIDSSGQLNITRDDPQVGSVLLHTVSSSDMVLVSASRANTISGDIKAYYEHQIGDMVVYLIVNSTYALFGSSNGHTFARETNPRHICMVKHSDETRVVRIYDQSTSLYVESVNFSPDGTPTVKLGQSLHTYDSTLVILCNQNDKPSAESVINRGFGVSDVLFDVWIYSTTFSSNNFAGTDIVYSQENEAFYNVLRAEHFVRGPYQRALDLGFTIDSLVFRSVEEDDNDRRQAFAMLAEKLNSWSLLYSVATSTSGTFYNQKELTGLTQCSGLTLSFFGEYGTFVSVLCQDNNGNDVLTLLHLIDGNTQSITRIGNTLKYSTITLRTSGLYILFFNSTAVTIDHLLLETGSFKYSIVGTDATTVVYFPVDAHLQLTLPGVSNVQQSLHLAGVFAEVSSLARVAVEPTADIRMFVSSSSGATELVSHLSVPALDNPNLATFYFFDANGNITATALLTNSEGKHESKIMNLFGQSNIKWYGCPSLLNEVGVPFVTTDSLSACTNGVSVLGPFDTNAVNLLTQYRLGVEFDDEDVMLCWGASNVTLGQPCGAHPVVHGSTTDCGAADGGSVDPFVCVDGEIFSFETVAHSVTTQCISLSGTCADSDIFPPTIYSLGFSECQAECINDFACFFFDHSNVLDCRLHSRTVGDTLYFKPCEAGFLGFICRDSASPDVFQTTVVLNPTPAQSTDPSFYTDISQGSTLLHRIVHGMKDDASLEVDQLGDDRDFVLTFFSGGSGVTGGTVVYVCGQDPPASQDHGNTTVLFSHPATEDDRFKNVTVQQCYHSTHHLTAYERMLMDAPVQSTRSCTSESAIESFYAVGFDDVSQERFQFYNTDSKPEQLDPTMQPPMSPVDNGPKFELPDYEVDFSSPYSPNNLNYGPLPGKAINTVVATNDPINVQPLTKWLQLALLPTEHAPHDIRPVRLETVQKAESISNYASNGGETVDPATDLKQYRITGQSNLELSDVFWGRHNNFKAHFSQLASKPSLSNETDTLAKYIFSMTEAVSTNRCPSVFNGSRCVLGRLTAPVMNPLFSDVVTVHGRKFAVGFTPYRVSPFVGIYLEGNEQSRDAMVMPDDGFIFEHGGVGYGAASNCTDNTTIFSFGGLDYGPDYRYRQFELLPFDMPAPLRWQPVWYRESVAFGCASQEDRCAHDFEENVLPQGDKANINSRFESVIHQIGHSHSKNVFWHWAAIRNIASINPAPDSKCGTGDYTINMKLL